VIEILNKQTPTNLNKMIRRFQTEKDLTVQVSPPDIRKVNKSFNSVKPRPSVSHSSTRQESVSEKNYTVQ
jgi:IS30 family transposase